MARGPLAGASGPGKFSARTDGLQLGSTAYGEGVETQAIKSGAPLARAQKTPSATNTEVRQAAAKAPVTPLFAPTQRPNEPVTSGVNIGAGPGSEVLGSTQQEEDTNFRATIAAYMPVLTYISGLPNTSPETRKAIRQLRDAL
jgi:hypothetical protein